jgi:hypothetical protein
MKIYLCGGINGLTDDQATYWREYVKEWYPQHDYLDPMRRDYRGREDECVTEIIDGDKADIVDSDVLLVNATRPSWGTAMEVFFAHSIGKRVLSVVPNDPVSPWLRYHSSGIYRTISSAMETLA